MNKLVIDVNTDKEPSDNDLIVYLDGGWRVVSRDFFLRGVVSKMTSLQKENRELNTKIENLSTNLSTLAKIIKETIK